MFPDIFFIVYDESLNSALASTTEERAKFIKGQKTLVEILLTPRRAVNGAHACIQTPSARNVPKSI
jgi:hypothetical protein